MNRVWMVVIEHPCNFYVSDIFKNVSSGRKGVLYHFKIHQQLCCACLAGWGAMYHQVPISVKCFIFLPGLEKAGLESLGTMDTCTEEGLPSPDSDNRLPFLWSPVGLWSA